MTIFYAVNVQWNLIEYPLINSLLKGTLHITCIRFQYKVLLSTCQFII